jgi:hypothetical protein
MERRRADAAEWPLQAPFEMFRDAGFDGAGVRFRSQNALAMKALIEHLRQRIQEPEFEVPARLPARFSSAASAINSSVSKYLDRNNPGSTSGFSTEDDP